MSQHKTALYKSMLDAVSQTLENMAFIEVTELSNEIEPTAIADVTWVSILIHDPLQGEIRMAMPRKLLTEMTANMFGIESSEITEEQEKDIIAEILNTLTGLFMTKLLPEDQTYQLGLPEHGEGPLPEIEEDAIVWHLQTEGSPLLLVATGAGLLRTDN